MVYIKVTYLADYFSLPSNCAYTSLIIAENCESASSNDPMISSISKDGTAGVLGNNALTININNSVLGSRCLCIKVVNSANSE